MKSCLSKFKFFPVSFYRLFFVHFDRKYNQAEENLNHRLDGVKHMFAIIQITFCFLSVLELRDHSKWRAKAKCF